MIWLWNERVEGDQLEARRERNKRAYLGLLDIRKTMVVGVEEREQASTELGRLQSFLETTRVEQRTLDDLEQDIVVPLVVISGE